jgi:hypothetical protein
LYSELWSAQETMFVEKEEGEGEGEGEEKGKDGEKK